VQPSTATYNYVVATIKHIYCVRNENASCIAKTTGKNIIPVRSPEEFSAYENASTIFKISAESPFHTKYIYNIFKYA
jgi:hypothetical protein